jgi:hypothetical protein
MKAHAANPFVALNSADDRLASWKELRKQIATLPDRDALAAVAAYWGNAPLSAHSYNPETPKEWPTPWEGIAKGDWCRKMVALAMEMTLRLAGWDASRLKLIYLRDYGISEELLVLKIDDRDVLNYIVGEVVEYPSTDQVITGVWQYCGRSYEAASY